MNRYLHQRTLSCLLPSILLIMNGCCPHGRFALAPDMNAADTELIALVRQAVEQCIPAERVEAFVGQQGFTTIRAGARADLQRVEVVEELGEPGHSRRVESDANVAYWARPLGDHPTKIVGIIWSEDGTPRLFFGHIPWSR